MDQSSSISLKNFGKQIHPDFYMEFSTLTNDVAELSGIVNLTSADVRLDMNRRECSDRRLICHILVYISLTNYHILDHNTSN